MFNKNSIILFQGDSITDVNRNREDYYGMGQGYPLLIKSYLMEKYPNLNLSFLNRGISGNRIVDLYARWKGDCINLKPDFISILIGINDVWHEYNNKQGVNDKKFKKIYSILLEETKESLPNAQVVLMEPFVLKASATMENFKNWEEDVKIRQDIVKDLAREYSCLFIPLGEKFNNVSLINNPSYWLFDGVHPTEAGHMIIAKEWLNLTGKIYNN